MTKPLLCERLRQSAPQLSVGMLTADWLALGTELKLLENAGVTLLHFDVMDGAFCPMMTFGPPVVAACRTTLYKDVHLMVEEPLSKLESYVAAGADLLTVHVESCRHPHRVLQALGAMSSVYEPARGILRGVALNPGTPLETIQPLLGELELVMLLAVNPGWGGQKFIPSTPGRLAQLKEMLEKSGRDVLVAVDGGITRANLAEVLALGPDIVVTGSAVFDGKNPAANLAWMLQAARSAARGAQPLPKAGS
jgi:ribulose-phosphate 3-epimerase